MLEGIQFLSSTPIFIRPPITGPQPIKSPKTTPETRPFLGVAGGRFDQGFSFMPTVPEGENVSSPAVFRGTGPIRSFFHSRNGFSFGGYETSKLGKGLLVYNV